MATYALLRSQGFRPGNRQSLTKTPAHLDCELRRQLHYRWETNVLLLVLTRWGAAPVKTSTDKNTREFPKVMVLTFGDICALQYCTGNFMALSKGPSPLLQKLKQLASRHKSIHLYPKHFCHATIPACMGLVSLKGTAHLDPLFSTGFGASVPVLIFLIFFSLGT